jgi:hypothetical protein
MTTPLEAAKAEAERLFRAGHSLSLCAEWAVLAYLKALNEQGPSDGMAAAANDYCLLPITRKLIFNNMLAAHIEELENGK